MATGDFQIRREQLAGGEALSGIPFYAQPIQQQFQAVELGLEEEGSHCVCHSIALAVFALIFTIGAAALIVMSGGNLNNLLYFVPGVVLGAGAVIMIAGVILKSVQSMGEMQEIEREVSGDNETLVPFNDFMAVLEAPETDKSHIEIALANFSDLERSRFVEGIYSAYFTTPDVVLTPEQKKVVMACASYPDTIHGIDFGTKERAFALMMLEANPNHVMLKTKLNACLGEPQSHEESVIMCRASMPANRDLALKHLKTLEQDGLPEKMLDLFAKVQVPQSAEECAILARHPQAFKEYVERTDVADATAVLKHLPVDWDNVEGMKALMDKLGLEPLDLQCKVLMRHPIAFSRKIEAEKPAYAIYVVKKLDKDELKGPVLQAVENVLKLNSSDVNDLAYFKTRPKLTASLASDCPHLFTPERVGKIFGLMDRAHKTIVLSKLAEALQDNDNDQAITVIRTAAHACLATLMTVEFAKATTPSAVAMATASVEQKDGLLKEIGKWPHYLAVALFSKKFNPGTPFLDALYRSMEDADGAALVNDRRAALDRMDVAQVGKDIAQQIQVAAVNPLPIITQAVLFSSHRIMASAVLVLSDPTPLDQQAIQSAQTIVNNMQNDRRDDFLKACIEMLDRLPNKLDILSKWLAGANSNADVMPDTLLIQYFKSHPIDFKAYVLENPKAGISEATRIALALHLLAGLGAAAEPIIRDLDSGLSLSGNATYNKLKNALNDKAKGTTTMSDVMQLLIARFEFAPQAQSTSMFGENAVDTSGREWTNFHDIATPLKSQVWMLPKPATPAKPAAPSSAASTPAKPVAPAVAAPKK